MKMQMLSSFREVSWQKVIPHPIIFLNSLPNRDCSVWISELCGLEGSILLCSVCAGVHIHVWVCAWVSELGRWVAMSKDTNICPIQKGRCVWPVFEMLLEWALSTEDPSSSSFLSHLSVPSIFSLCPQKALHWTWSTRLLSFRNGLFPQSLTANGPCPAYLEDGVFQ